MGRMIIVIRHAPLAYSGDWFHAEILDENIQGEGSMKASCGGSLAFVIGTVRTWGPMLVDGGG